MGKVVNLPNTKQVEFGGLSLQLRLDGRTIVAIEKRLDKSLFGLFMSGQGGMKLPPSNELLIVLQGANKASGVKDSDIIDAFDKYIEEGNTTMDLQGIVQELLDETGFFGKEKDKEKTDTESEENEVLLDKQELMTEDEL
ncbi:DUF6096 family protein [Carnobacterium maltaromaticum]|uniref:DUF6096 family protein n=1 Tax=Carnobacterium maltaromaticum TaxID=2751 RepID=UPI0039AFA67C